MESPDPTAPDLDQILAIAEETLAALPAPIRAHAAQLVIRVEEFPSEAVLADMEIEDPFELTGLYQGIPLTEKSLADQMVQPDTVWLYRRPILDEWVSRGDVGLRALVAHVVIHEIAHHFGWSDDDIAQIDRWWE